MTSQMAFLLFETLYEDVTFRFKGGKIHLLQCNKRYYYISHLLRALINWFRQGRLQFMNKPDIKQIWPYYVFNLNCMISRPNFSTLDGLLVASSGMILWTVMMADFYLSPDEDTRKECRRDQRFAYANLSFSVETSIESSCSSVIYHLYPPLLREN